MLNGPIDRIDRHRMSSSRLQRIQGDAWQSIRATSAWNEICDICEKAPVTYINDLLPRPRCLLVGGSGSTAATAPAHDSAAGLPVLPNGDYLIDRCQFASSSDIDYGAATGGPGRATNPGECR